MKNRLCILCIASQLCVCCGERKPEPFAALPFPEVGVPSMLEGDAERVEYMALNYWNLLTDTSRTFPCDSVYVSGVRKDEVEQKFADWTVLLDAVEPSVSGKAVARLYERAVACERKDSSSNVFETFVYLADKYFYDPNSPVRNEDRYLPFVSRLASYEGLDRLVRGRYEREARLCAMNRTGTRAADFRFSDRNGRIYTLYGIEAEYTLLFFSNPGCTACKQIMAMLDGSPAVSGYIKSGRLAVANIYIDEDLEAWRSYLPEYPAEWYNGFDPELAIRDGGLYGIRAIPSLYLLGRDKTVLLKDAPERRVVAFFEALANREHIK